MPFKTKIATQEEMSIETIDSNKAEEYLAKNLLLNRQISRPFVRKLSKVITQGDWKLTGDPIRFDVNGDLIDGQHRLKAIAETGATVEAYVMRNCDVSLYENLDQGRQRHLRDTMRSSGAQQEAATTAIVRLLYQLQAEDPKMSLKKQPTMPESRRFWESLGGNDVLIPYINRGRTANKETGLRGSVVSTLMMIHDQVDPELSDKFWRGVIDLEGIDGNHDPRTRLRTFVQMERERRKEGKSSSRNRNSESSATISIRELLGWSQIAFRHYRMGRTLTKREAETLFNGENSIGHINDAIADIRRVLEISPIGTLPK